jgi:ABC-type lipoprotein release transport system permease subunit
MSLKYKNKFDSYTDRSKIYAKIKQLPSFLQYYKDLLSAHWASQQEFEKTEQGKTDIQTKKKKKEMNRRWRKRKKQELTVEQWSTRNVVYYSQLHETLNVIHTCCGIIIIIIIISLNKTVVAKL